MAVIKDVAKIAGVSTATVSKVINRPDTVRGSTRARVLEVMKELEYIPSPIARGMRTKRTNHIAVVSADIRNPFFAELYACLGADIKKNGFTPVLYTLDNGNSSIRDVISDIIASKADGVVFCFPDDHTDTGSVDYRELLPMPFVLISRDMSNIKYASVILDVYEGIREVTKHLISLGHEKLAFIGGPGHSRISREKLRGFISALNSVKLPLPDEYICGGDYSLKNGFMRAKDLMRLEAPPSAIVCANDIIAIGCMKYLLNTGIRIPGEVAVSGFDNISLASMYEPALTTAAIPVEDICRACAEMITELAADKNKPKKSLIFKTKLIIRNSTDKYAPIEL